MTTSYYNRSIFSTYTAVLGIATVASGCLREIPYGDMQEKLPVCISLDWCNLFPDASAPDSIHFRFYPQGGGRVIDFTTRINTDCRQFLPPGTYQVLVFNTDVTTLSFRNLDSYAMAEVFLSTQSKASAIIPPSDLLYGASIERLEVYGAGVLTQALAPQRLVQRISFSIQVKGIENIADCSGDLSGVSTSLNLSQGKASSENPATVALTTSLSESKIIGSTVVLGLNPKTDTTPAIPNIVTLNFKLADGSEVSSQTDMTEQFDQMADGDIDVSIEAIVETLPFFTVKITSWTVAPTEEIVPD